MKYIKKVILENFQSHKYTELEFDENLNVIVGPSDQGKSAIIRGIKWALFNEPSGDFFIREGESDCSVTIQFNDGIKIKRYKSKNKNLYCLYDSSGEEQIFEGFGKNVPKEIIDATNIRKVYLDGKQTNSINISDQLEGPFLLSEKTSTRANAIGRLVGVHIIDDAVGETLKDIRNLNLSRRNLTNQLDKLENNLKEYNYLEELKSTVKKLDEIKNEIKQLEDKSMKLKKISIEYNNIEKETKDLKNLSIKLENINTVESITNDLNMKVKTYNFIDNRRKYLFDINKNICYNENIVNSLENLHRVSELVKESEDKVIKKNRLEVVDSNCKLVKKNIKANYNILTELKNIDIVDKKISFIYDDSKKLIELISTKKKFDENNMRTIYGRNYLEKFSQINYVDKVFSVLEKKVLILSKLINFQNEKNITQSELNSTKKAIKKENKQIEYYLREYKRLLEQFEVCPLCFHKIDNETIEEIINNYN
ncbi:AAA family ATPase [Anaerosalibacter massiliensis]|uniref:Nuclease SbcCD subunit C n=1 Tax=Anaerosalibacter massiliensis TaxID=1347392 RepID=A0A9X2MEV7_9FIRM|nr:AAA family ATPase [Anaerosalibacter massiliensis]MCR2042710.1 AAA family ATPase [Anaerosalibacter massiliensis]